LGRLPAAAEIDGRAFHDGGKTMMRGSLGGPRVLLRRLREVMNDPVSAQERLDRIVVLIASNMVAEVCSVYVLKADGALELYATEGLNRAAVHQTTMRAGEGLVGLIAETAELLNLSDAQHHPRFSYRPETGEEIYNSFLGVPILRAGNTIGVLVVQNSARRTYTEEETEALQTTAMVMAEMLATGELELLATPGTGGIAVRKPLSLRGQSITDGVGLGHVVLHEPRVVIKNLVADDPDAEVKRLEEALQGLQASIDTLIEGEGLGAGEHREILETFRMFAHDRGWLRRMSEAIRSGLTAEAAVERVQSDTRAKLLRQTDPYLRERLHDLDDLANRLLHQLTGEAFTLAAGRLQHRAIERLLRFGARHGGRHHEQDLGAEEADAGGVHLRELRHVDEQPGVHLQRDLDAVLRGGWLFAQLRVLRLTASA
jgi:phosphotransferase system, enzyme I, PtsP